MSMDSNLYDLDTKIIYDTNGGRDLWWLLDSLIGHRVIIDHDNNEGYNAGREDSLLDNVFKQVNASTLEKPIEFQNKDVYEEHYLLRWTAVMLGRGLADDTKDFIDDKEIISQCTLTLGYDKELQEYYFVNEGIVALFKNAEFIENYTCIWEGDINYSIVNDVINGRHICTLTAEDVYIKNLCESQDLLSVEYMARPLTFLKAVEERFNHYLFKCGKVNETIRDLVSNNRLPVKPVRLDYTLNSFLDLNTNLENRIKYLVITNANQYNHQYMTFINNLTRLVALLDKQEV